MNVLQIFVFSFVVFSCRNSTGFKGAEPALKDTIAIFQPLLPEGTHEVLCFEMKTVTAAHRQALNKLTQLYNGNKKARAFFKEVEDRASPAYKVSMGLTRQEYNLLIDLFAYNEPSRFSNLLTIRKEGTRYLFKGSERLNIFDSVTADIYGRFATYKQIKMNRVTDSVDLSAEYIPEGDTLEPYALLSGPDGIAGLTGINGKYELLIGRLKPGNRIYLSFFAKHPAGGDDPFPKYIVAILDK